VAEGVNSVSHFQVTTICRQTCLSHWDLPTGDGLKSKASNAIGMESFGGNSTLRSRKLNSQI
jgi:hypothetical protein